jgi:phage gp29-like protein
MLVITSTTLLTKTTLANAIVICIDKYNQTNVIPCSDQNAIVRTSGQETNMTKTLTASNMTSSTSTSPNTNANNTTNTSTNATNSSSTLSIKSLIEDAMQEIQNNDTSKALERMNLADQQLSTAGNTTSIQQEKVFIDDAIQLLQQNHDVNTALARRSTIGCTISTNYFRKCYR